MGEVRIVARMTARNFFENPARFLHLRTCFFMTSRYHLFLRRRQLELFKLS
jgi:hypothetical protein